MGTQFGRRPLVGLMLSLIALSTTAAPDRALAQVAYSKIDRATVRVIGVGGIKTLRVTTKSDKTYRLAMPEVGHGSGILVAEMGLILTAQHVIKDARFLAVRLPGKSKAYPAEVVFVDERHDFAFLAIPESSTQVLPLPEQVPQLAVRQRVFAVGYPLDADRERPQSTQGIVSGVLGDGQLQLGISVNPGNSGGPVIDENDQLVGLLVARGRPELGVQGIGVAVPLDRIAKVHDKIIRPGGAFDRASKKVRDVGRGAWLKASAAAELVEGQTTLGIVREATRAAVSDAKAPIRKSIVRAVNANKGDADALALAGAYYWNAAHVHEELGKDSWVKNLSRAKRLCKKAAKADRSLLERSSFVGMVLSER